MKRAREALDERPFQRIVVYGDSGVGKTTWGAFAPRPLFLLTEENGLASVNAANPDAFVALIETFKNVRASVAALAQAPAITLDDGQVALEVKGEPVQTIVLDSLTNIAELARAEATGDEDDGTSMREWGKAIRSVRLLLEQVRRLPVNVIATALTSETGGGGQPRRTLPDLYGKSLPTSIPQYFTGCAFVGRHSDGQHVLGWSLGPRFVTKPPASRHAAVPRSIPFGPDGLGSLGSLLLYLYPGSAGVAHMPDDSADKIRPVTAAASS